MNYEPVIGLEVHAQLKTKSKLFCRCSIQFGSEPNTQICPVCTAQPGALPVLNKEAVEMAIKAGLALHCKIQEKSIFARKNYFYPDLPKGYQISQYELPLCLNGHLDNVSIQRIHMEEDAGKLMHDTGEDETSHVDLNRCSTPLIEIVSGPDIFSPEAASEYLKKLRNILVYLDVCDGNMQEGSLRCDANISLRPIGSKELGTRSEIKNVNSFKFLEKALLFEIDRQTKILDSGQKVIQETRLWNSIKGTTESMRGKEEAHDYRYFPDPDLLPLIVEKEWVEGVKKNLPELPEAKGARFVKDFGIPEYDAAVLTGEKELADYFEEAVGVCNSPKKISNWIMAELMRELKKEGASLATIAIRPAHLAKLVELIDKGTISGTIGKQVFEEMLVSGKEPDKIVKEKGWGQVSDTQAIEKVIDKILLENRKNIDAYKSGKKNVLGFFVGQVMKEMKGQANPKIINEILIKKLG